MVSFRATRRCSTLGMILCNRSRKLPSVQAISTLLLDAVISTASSRACFAIESFSNVSFACSGVMSFSALNFVRQALRSRRTDEPAIGHSVEASRSSAIRRRWHFPRCVLLESIRRLVECDLKLSRDTHDRYRSSDGWIPAKRFRKNANFIDARIDANAFSRCHHHRHDCC